MYDNINFHQTRQYILNYYIYIYIYLTVTVPQDIFSNMYCNLVVNTYALGSGSDSLEILLVLYTVKVFFNT